MTSDPAARVPVTPASGAGAVGIVLVDDHAIVRQGLRSVLERERDLRIVGEASNPDDAMAVVERTRPAVVLLDLKLSTGADSQGLELCSRLTARYPGLGVLVLTTFLDDNLVAQAIHRGARGYVIKAVAATDALRHRGAAEPAPLQRIRYNLILLQQSLTRLCAAPAAGLRPSALRPDTASR